MILKNIFINKITIKTISNKIIKMIKNATGEFQGDKMTISSEWFSGEKNWWKILEGRVVKRRR